MTSVHDQLLATLGFDSSERDSIETLFDRAEDIEWVLYVLEQSIDQTDSTDEALSLAKQTLKKFPVPPENPAQ